MSIVKASDLINRMDDLTMIQNTIRSCEISLQEKMQKVLRLKSSSDPWKQLEARTLLNEVEEEKQLLNQYKSQYKVA